MKASRIILIAIFACLATTGLKAQMYIGGGFGINTIGGKFDNGNQVTDKPSEFNFNFSPEFGKFLSEKTAIGVSLNLGLSVKNNNAAVETIDTETEFGISPYLRYYAITAGKFSVFGQGNIGFAYAVTKSKNGETTTDGPKHTQFAFTVLPGLAYELNDKISLETSMNILSLGYVVSTATSGDNKTTNFRYNFGAGLNNIVNVGSITIGAIYKF